MTGAESRVSMTRIGLDVMVPMRMWELRNFPERDLLAMTPDLGDYIASHGDEIEHGGASQGEGLGRLATAIATLALLRAEGVDLFGGHWCRDHANHMKAVV